MLKPFLRAIFGKDPSLAAGRALYEAAVHQARLEPLYADFKSPDTLEGRFEQVALHVYLLMRRLKSDDAGAGAPDKEKLRDNLGANPKEVSQCLFDAMFQNMDDSLRELGVGDLSVGKKIRKLAENFYGRIGAYEDALSSGMNTDGSPKIAEPGDLAKALGRNIYGDELAEGAAALAVYVRQTDIALARQPLARVAAGIVMFPRPQIA